jgi:hypothetical protein
MDGRVQFPIINWMKKTCELDYIDMITEPGPENILLNGSAQQKESIKNKILISVNNHGSQSIIVAAHDDCAGNPISKDEHIKQVKECINLIKSWKLPVVNVIGAWLDIEQNIELIKE